MAVCLSCFGATPQPVKAYLQRAQKLVVEHRRNVNRLKAPSELVAEALFAGGAFYLTGSDAGWISEGTSRAGGPMSIRHLSSTTVARPGDVVWLNYSAGTYNAQLQAGAELEQKKCLVLAFGPRPTSGAPGFQHWIDSMTPWNADHNFTLLGNVLSLWTLTGEVAGASARRGENAGVLSKCGYAGIRATQPTLQRGAPFTPPGSHAWSLSSPEWPHAPTWITSKRCFMGSKHTRLTRSSQRGRRWPGGPLPIPHCSCPFRT